MNVTRLSRERTSCARRVHVGRTARKHSSETDAKRGLRSDRVSQRARTCARGCSAQRFGGPHTNVACSRLDELDRAHLHVVAAPELTARDARVATLALLVAIGSLRAVGGGQMEGGSDDTSHARRSRRARRALHIVVPHSAADPYVRARGAGGRRVRAPPRRARVRAACRT